MNHKPILSSEEKSYKIAWLRKQRDGLIIGSYRNKLSIAYKRIEYFSSQFDQDCTISNILDFYCFNNTHFRQSFLDYCLDLEQLGYIKITKCHKDYVIKILKELDF